MVYSKLLIKLAGYGIHYELLSWIENFLSDRSHWVTINGKYSEFLPAEIFWISSRWNILNFFPLKYSEFLPAEIFWISSRWNILNFFPLKYSEFLPAEIFWISSRWNILNFFPLKYSEFLPARDVLHPLLFILYINDLLRRLQLNVSSLLTTPMHSIKSRPLPIVYLFNYRSTQYLPGHYCGSSHWTSLKVLFCISVEEILISPVI